MQGYGYIESYVHWNQIGVLVQLSCPDSFALKTSEFIALAKDIAIHIAASKPVALEPSKLDPSIRNAELAHYKQQLSTMSEKERIERVQNINDRINRDLCLYLQPYVKDPAQTVGEHIDSVASQLGVGIQVVRFVRWEQNET